MGAWGCLALTGSQSLAIARRLGGYDAIIVPGVPFGDSATSDLMKMRVLWATWLYKQGVARNIIFSGSAVYTPYVEARAMGEMAIKAGVPASHIFYEELAEHSTENLVLGYRLARQLGFKRVALASDFVQTWLLDQVMDRLGVAGVGLLPLVPGRIRHLMNSCDLTVHVPPVNTAEFVPLSQREAPKERLRGTMGRKIPEKLYQQASIESFQQ
ncbi:MAG: YdcF family protein [Flavobacteriales bacterium]|nr:YdcF family protein [Flavobacteriales bacterium]MCX7769269.1 YdcF family protein [Flavobacteriales bacterium]MDW8409984.1 YdcF family protein [Flavobacteriales bacterium]